MKRKPLVDHFSSSLEILRFRNTIKSDPETILDLIVLSVPATFANHVQFHESLSAVITGNTFHSIFFFYSTVLYRHFPPSFTVRMLRKFLNVEIYI